MTTLQNIGNVSDQSNSIHIYYSIHTKHLNCKYFISKVVADSGLPFISKTATAGLKTLEKLAGSKSFRSPKKSKDGKCRL